MIRGIGKDIMDSRTEFVGMSFYRPRGQTYGPLTCSELRIVQRVSIAPYETQRMSWDFPDIVLHLSGNVPTNLETLSINCHWRDTDLIKAAYALNKDDKLIVDVYFGNMSINDRKNRMIRNTVTFQPKISTPRARNSKYLNLATDETIAFDNNFSSLLTVNNEYGRFWNESWLEEK